MEHSSLLGLLADDHPQYIKRVGDTFELNASITLQGQDSTGKLIRLIADQPEAAGIAKLLSFEATNAWDRPWAVWYDHGARLRVGMGYHSLDYDSQAWHNRFEIKTSTDPNDTNPLMMHTRFAIDTDKVYANFDFNTVNKIQINHGFYHQNAGFGIMFRTMNSTNTAGVDLVSWLAKHDTSDNTIMDFDLYTFASSKTATLRFFRSTNTTGAKFLQVFKGDNTATKTFEINANTGGISLLGNTGANNEGILFLDTYLYRSAANGLKTSGSFDASSYKVGGMSGVSGSFQTKDNKTVTITNGIITEIV